MFQQIENRIDLGIPSFICLLGARKKMQQTLGMGLSTSIFSYAMKLSFLYTNQPDYFRGVERTLTKERE